MTLVDKLRARDEAAFAEVYDQHGKAVYNFLKRLCGNKSLADDLFQDTWLQLVRYAPRLRADSNVPAWLCVVARNAFRKHRRFVLLDGERLQQWRWALAKEPSEKEAPAHLDAQLEAALAHLAIADREIILLANQNEQSQDSLAALLDISPATFRQRLSRARRRLAQEVKDE